MTGFDEDALLLALATEHQRLIRTLTAELDLETGVELALAPARYGELTRELSDELDLEAGLDAILGPPAQDIQGQLDDLDEAWKAATEDDQQAGRPTCSVEAAEAINLIANICALIIAPQRGSLEFYTNLIHPLLRLWSQLKQGTLTPHRAQVLTKDLLELVERYAPDRGDLYDEVASVSADAQALHRLVTRPSFRPAAGPSNPPAAQAAVAVLAELWSGLLEGVPGQSQPVTIRLLRSGESRFERSRLLAHSTTRQELVELWRLLEHRAVSRGPAVELARRIANRINDADSAALDGRLHQLGEDLPGVVRRLFDPADHDAPTPAHSR